jgi:two-component system, cell cycle response regulator DivK
MAKESILIVDDNEMNLKLLRWLLEKNGYEVHTAGDAKTARASVRAVHPRLVLMDIQLPDIDGLQLTREFKADPQLRDIPVVAVTSYAMKGDRQKSVDAGCDGYITKPIDTRQFPLDIEKYLRGTRSGSSG